ncbi:MULTISPECIES: lactococcin 972 family bacteriocin [Bacillus cereus group]|uniref:lactococcin 972 family bacteriocin n=1 Tax=Bacillus cereus group TaxID=86661 RepID=UPI000BF6B48B|nr:MULTISPECIES: lactococcin 972 family bacteriocin [Bacillus cereus group]PFO91708.1 hypothetical protein COJ97_27425 [Bacillus cereus]
MKKIIAASSLGLMLLASGANAFASGTEENYGEVNYDKQNPYAKKVEYVGGGTWEHFIDGIYSNYSKYEHDKKTHKTTVGNSSSSKTSGWVSARVPAEASIKPSISGNTANWNTK